MPFFSRKKSIVRAPCPPAPVGGGGASTISANMDTTDSHELTVSGYSGTKGLGVGKVISSVAFTAGGHSWKIRYYPDGCNKESADWISIYLQLVDSPIPNNGDVRAQFRFSLLDQVGKPWFAQTSLMRTFSTGESWGYAEFIKRKNLESSSHPLKDDSFVISCHITVIKIRAETAPVQFVTAPSRDLARDLGGLLESKVGGDVKFKVGKEMFTAHRYVLAARSPVFEAELFGHMREEKKKKAHIPIDDMEAKVFKALLHFIYTDSLPDMDEGEERVMAQHLLVAADRYDLKRLKLICEGTLCNFVDTSTLATTLALAEQHDCLRLKERCFRFLKAPGNMNAVMETDGYEHMMKSCPSLLNELLQKVAP